jgi:hypothetical protein
MTEDNKDNTDSTVGIQPTVSAISVETCGTRRQHFELPEDGKKLWPKHVAEIINNKEKHSATGC